MENKTKGVYFGIDINNKRTLISYYKQNMNEPETVSTMLGSENYIIPTFLSKRKGMGQWYFGEEAKSAVIAGEAFGVDNLYQDALDRQNSMVEGQSYDSRELLVIFFKKLFSIPSSGYAGLKLEKLAICVERVNLEVMELFSYVANHLGISQNNLILIDYRESFYYYALNQNPQLFQYKVALFDYSNKNMSSMSLRINTATRPRTINIDENYYGQLAANKDIAFEQIIDSALSNELYSSVYLVGEDFDGDWMKSSLVKLCKGRSVFLGKNLYSKGACYIAYIRDNNRDWPFLYIGDNELKLNLSIKILKNNELSFLTLIDAGESWYEAVGECEVILDGDSEIEFFIQKPDSREAHVELLELEDLPVRENRCTRLRITAKPVSDKEINISIRDLGFGEIYPATNKVWEHIISIS